MDMHEPAKYPH